MNIEYNSITLKMEAGTSIVTGKFPQINGEITGLSTHTTGDKAGKTVRLTILNGGNEHHDPLDVAFTETEGRSSFKEGIIEMNISKPGLMTAKAILEGELGAGETINIEVLLVSKEKETGQEAFCN